MLRNLRTEGTAEEDGPVAGSESLPLRRSRPSSRRLLPCDRALHRRLSTWRPSTDRPPASIHACTRSSLMRRAFGIFAHLRNAPFCSASSLENSVLLFAAPVGAAAAARDARPLGRTEARPPARRAL